MKEKPIRDYDRFILRMPDGLRERLMSRAKANGRSMNAEITALLLTALDPTAAEFVATQEELRAAERARHDAAGALEAADRRLYALVDRMQDLQKALGVEATISEDEI